MLKREEIVNGKSCFNLAAPEEMMFCLVARDAAAADTIRFWCGLRVKLGVNAAEDAQIVSAMETAELMEQQHGDIRVSLGKSRLQGARVEGDGSPT